MESAESRRRMYVRATRFVMSNFRKREDCPPSSELLMFQRGQIPAADLTAIFTHLAYCEFCSAEVEFYAHYPQRDEWVRPSPIPPPLYDLASAILRRGKSGLAWLDGLLHSSKNN